VADADRLADLMLTCHQLELRDVRLIVAAAHTAAATHVDTAGTARVSIAVVDAGGHLLSLDRCDGASPASAETAMAKARMAALNGKATAPQEQAINNERPALAQLAGIFGQPAVAMAGGIPLLHNGHCLGAIGVSGMTPEIDLAIAEAGAAIVTTLTP
jgi:glc operon protein GlcG